MGTDHDLGSGEEVDLLVEGASAQREAREAERFELGDEAILVGEASLFGGDAEPVERLLFVGGAAGVDDEVIPAGLVPAAEAQDLESGQHVEHPVVERVGVAERDRRGRALQALEVPGTEPTPDRVVPFVGDEAERHLGEEAVVGGDDAAEVSGRPAARHGQDELGPSRAMVGVCEWVAGAARTSTTSRAAG